jgi:hypothetical protein
LVSKRHVVVQKVYFDQRLKLYLVHTIEFGS